MTKKQYEHCISCKTTFAAPQFRARCSKCADALRKKLLVLRSRPWCEVKMVDRSLIYFVCSHADCEAPMQLFEDISGALKDSEPTIDRINQAFKVFKKAHGHVKKAEPTLSPLQAALLSCIARVDRKELADSTYIAIRAAEDYRREVLNLTNWHLPVASQGARYVWTINGIRNLKIMAKRGLVEQHTQRDLYTCWVITEAGRKVLSEC